jgi:quinol monooxygenase YgiN
VNGTAATPVRTLPIAEFSPLPTRRTTSGTDRLVLQGSVSLSVGDPLPNAPNDFAGCHYSAGMNYGFFGKFSVQPDRRDDLVNYLLRAAKLLEGNPGCIHYIVSTSEEPEAVWVSEVWTSVAAHDASLEPEDIQALIQEARPLITGMSDQTQLTVHGGKGLPS